MHGFEKQVRIDKKCLALHAWFMQDWQNPYAAVLEQWAAALNSGDLPTLLGLYTDDAMLVPTMVGTFLENDSSRAAYFKKLLGQQMQVQFSAELPHEIICGDIAILSGDYDFIAPDRTVHARFSFTLINQNGAWKIIHHHSSQTPDKILLVDKPMLEAV